jgi:hypothetical protein
LREKRRSIGNEKLGGFQGSHVRCVRLVEQDGKFAEHGAGLRHRSDLDVVLDNYNNTISEDQQPASPRPSGEHGFACLIGCNRKGGEHFLKDRPVKDRGHSTAHWLYSTITLTTSTTRVGLKDCN